MYKEEFDKLTTLPNYLLFYGNEYFLNEYQKKIENKFKNDNVLKLYFNDYNFELAKEHLLENSLFGGKNVLIIKHDKVIKNIEELIKLSKNGYFFFFFYGNKKIDAFKKNFVRFFEPNINDLFFKIDEVAKKFNVKISNEAKLYLARSIDASLIEKEIEKLANYKDEIRVFDVEENIFIYKDEHFEDIFVKILSGEDFQYDLEMFLQTNDYKRFIPALMRYIKDLFLYKLYLNKGNSSLKGLLGYQLPRDIENIRINLSNNIDEKKLYNVLSFLALKELEMRKSDKNKEAIFYEVISFLKLNFHSS